MIGERIREFEIRAELGAGGYGAVYLAHDTGVNRDVAIKVILPQYADKPDFKQRFEAEARLVAKLECRQIVPLYGYWQDEHGAFLVMRYIRGGSLRRLMAKQGALPLAQTIRILTDIGEALAVAHEQGVVHRDLKPENILIDERGNAYLTDFGIAKQTSENSNITEPDAIVGTLAYLAPEQVRNEPVSPQTDLYAFGILLYEMLAGKHPFQDVAPMMMVMKHLQEPLPSLSSARPDLPQRLDEIIECATAKKPEARYVSVLEAVADLKATTNETVIRSEPIEIKKPTSPEERNRYAMLQNVRSFWVEGVLENSLHSAAMIELGMKLNPGAVANPWDTLLRTPSGEELLADGSILNVFDRMNGKLLILGDPGGGKTTTLLTLARDLLFRAELDAQHPIPVVFNLSSWSEKRAPIGEWLVDELNSKYQVPRKIATQWVADDDLLLLLDGLDEVAAEAREACVKAINTYRSEHGFVDVVVCSRVKDYHLLTEHLRLNGAIVIQPLDDVQIVEYLDALGPDVAVVRDLIAADAQMRTLAQSPLMLSIMVLAYRGKTADEMPDFNDLEKQRQHLFDVYVERMLNRRIGPYTDEESKRYLKWLARKLIENTQTLFHIENLQPTWLDGAEYKTYQILYRAIIMAVYTLLYFAVHLIVVPVGLFATQDFQVQPGTIGTIWLTGTLLGVVIGTVIATDLFQRWLAAILGGFCTALAMSLILGSGGMNGVFMGLGFGGIWMLSYVMGITYQKRLHGHVQPEMIVMVEKAGWSLHNVRLRTVVTGGITGLIGSLAGILTFPMGEASLSRYALAAVLMSAATIASAAFADGLKFGVFEMRQRPNEGVRRSLLNANRLFVGSAFSVFILYFPGLALIMPPMAGVAGLLLSTSYIFSGLWMIFGGITAIQHLALRLALVRSGHAPLNMARFLDTAADLILVRKVGGGYTFIHRYLMEYFAE